MKNNRLARVISGMERMGLEQIIVSAPASLFYLTGKWITPGERMVALYLTSDGEVALYANRLFALKGTVDVPLIQYDDVDDPAKLLAGANPSRPHWHRQILAKPVYHPPHGRTR